MGNISYQITGLPPFTDNEFSTIGNDWGLAHKILTETDKNNIGTIVAEIGTKLQRDGWRGLFGVDVVLDEKSKRVYLIEVNARQPASATYESFLEEQAREKGAAGVTIFEAHLMALLGSPIEEDVIEITDGAQILQRVTKSIQAIFDDVGDKLEKKGYQAISYQNADMNADLLRVQSPTSIMESHGSFNSKGIEIMEAIKTSRLNLEV
jgi:formate-dependent phosphoribosylglycinamide formyltransferase (GAR transformylase)